MGATLGNRAAAQIAKLIKDFRYYLANRPVEFNRAPYGDQPRYIGKAAADIAKGATGNVRRWSRGATSLGEDADKGEEADTEDTFACYARMGAISNGDWVFIEFIDGGWEVYQAECSA